MAIARQSLTKGSQDAGAGTTITTSVTVSAGSDLLLLVSVHLEGNNAGGDHVTSVVWNGTALTELAKCWGANWAETQIFYLKNPTPATGNLVTTVTNTNDMPIEQVAEVFTGVDQTTTFRTAQTTGTGASGTSSSQTVPSVVSGDYVVDAITIDATGHTVTVGANQTKDYDDALFGATTADGSNQAGADGGVMSWSWTGSAPFAHISTALIASGGVTRTFSLATTGASAPSFALAGMVDTFTLATTGQSVPTFSLAGMVDVFTLASSGTSVPTFGVRAIRNVQFAATGTSAPTFTLAGMVDVFSFASAGVSAPAFNVTRSGLPTFALATTGTSAPSFTLAGMVDTFTLATAGASAPSFGVSSQPPVGGVTPERALVGAGV